MSLRLAKIGRCDDRGSRLNGKESGSSDVIGGLSRGVNVVKSE